MNNDTSQSPKKTLNALDFVSPNPSKEAMKVILGAFDRATKEQNRLLKKAAKISK